MEPARASRLDPVLHHLKAVVDGVAAVPPMPLEDARQHLADLGVRLPLDLFGAKTVQWKVQYEPPASVAVVGSYLLRTGVRPTLNVDVAVEMPEVRVRALGPRLGRCRRDLRLTRGQSPTTPARSASPSTASVPSQGPPELSLPPQARVLPRRAGRCP